jgi:hypothetical protein
MNKSFFFFEVMTPLWLILSDTLTAAKVKSEWAVLMILLSNATSYYFRQKHSPTLYYFERWIKMYKNDVCGTAEKPSFDPKL